MNNLELNMESVNIESALQETPGLTLSAPRITYKDEEDYEGRLEIDINGKTYKYRLNPEAGEITTRDIAKKIAGIQKYSDGKALAYLKKNMHLVNESVSKDIVGKYITVDTNFRGVTPKLRRDIVLDVQSGLATKDNPNPPKQIKLMNKAGKEYWVDENQIVSESVSPEALKTYLYDYRENAFGYDGIQDYVETQFPTHSKEFKDEVILYLKKHINESFTLKEDFGGAYDIDPEMYFSREEINEFGFRVRDEVEDITGDNFEISDISMLDNKTLNIELICDGAIHSAKIKIDYRKIRKPSDIVRYLSVAVDQIVDSYKEYNDIYELNAEDLYESLGDSYENLILNDIKSAFYDKAINDPEWGYESVRDVNDFLNPQFEVEKQDNGEYRVEVRAEYITYDSQADMENSLNLLIKDYDPETWFDTVDPGISVAFINPGNLQESVDLSNEDTEVLKVISAVYQDRGEVNSEEAVKDIESRLSNMSLDADYLGDMIVRFKETLNEGQLSLKLENWRDGTWDQKDCDDWRQDMNDHIWLVQLSVKGVLKKHPEYKDQIKDVVINARNTFSNLLTSEKEFVESLKENLSGEYSDKFNILINKYLYDYQYEALAQLAHDLVRYSKEDDLKDLYYDRGYSDIKEESLSNEDGWSDEVAGVFSRFRYMIDNLSYELDYTVRGAKTKAITVDELRDYCKRVVGELEDVIETLDLEKESLTESDKELSFKDHHLCNGCGKPLSQCECEVEEEDYPDNQDHLVEGTRYKRIACYGEFDNGHVLHDWTRMSSEDAESKAKQASIEDPYNIYYVAYDDVMNSSSDLRWINGKSYSYDDYKYIGIREGKPYVLTKNNINILNGHIEEDIGNSYPDDLDECTQPSSVGQHKLDSIDLIQ